MTEGLETAQSVTRRKRRMNERRQAQRWYFSQKAGPGTRSPPETQEEGAGRGGRLAQPRGSSACLRSQGHDSGSEGR